MREEEKWRKKMKVKTGRTVIFLGTKMGPMSPVWCFILYKQSVHEAIKVYGIYVLGISMKNLISLAYSLLILRNNLKLYLVDSIGQFVSPLVCLSVEIISKANISNIYWTDVHSEQAIGKFRTGAYCALKLNENFKVKIFKCSH